MNKITAVIITFNEEKNILRCLESVKDVVDEIVVVDSFSKDRTKEICKNFGVRFYENYFEGHIQQKNYAASLAENDYVLSLDADEALNTELRDNILKLKTTSLKDGYFMNRLTNYLGTWLKHGSWYPDRKMRLWNRHKGTWTGRNPHDCYQLNDGSTVGHIRGDILHYSYYSIEGHLDQMNKFTTISALEFHNEGKKAGLIKIFMSPLVSFIKGFFLKLAFLDGYRGIVVCFINAFATFIKYVKLRELNKTERKLKS